MTQMQIHQPTHYRKTQMIENSKSLNTLVVDDEETSTLIMSTILSELGFHVDSESSAESMDVRLRTNHYDIVFLDYRLGNSNGLDALATIIKDYPSTRVIMITGHGSIELATKAMHLGASGFITKPFNEETVKLEVKRAFRDKTPDNKLFNIDELQDESGIIGSSDAITRIHSQIHKMKNVDTTVLINGESGTGKELIARALHQLSCRKSEPFEAINCAAIPETLLEAELFGYKKGAFTDAKTDRKGLFESCSKGTLFLDEIGELPLQLQSKLLRALQEKQITPLGASQSISVGTRIIAATNRNLKSQVINGDFRKDLYYRLSILQIDSPPLRDRLEDIPELTRFFVSALSEKFNKVIKTPKAEIMSRLESYDWPGNVRELQNALERAVVLSDDGELRLGDIFDHLGDDAPAADDADLEISFVKPLSEAKEDFERTYLIKVLKACRGNVTQASRLSGRLRTDMYRLFSKHDIDPNDFKPH